MILVWCVLAVVEALSQSRGSAPRLGNLDRPLVSVPIPGSPSARLEVPSVNKLRELSAAIRGDLRDAGGAVAIARRSFAAQQALAEVALEFVREQPGSGEAAASRAASFARRLCEKLGGTYIKLGQLVASSPTLFPREVVAEFESCLDRAPPVPFEEVKAVVEEALGQPLTSLYASFDPVPLATASVAQVHCATLKATGERVVVKVRKPGVEATLRCDLAFVAIVANSLEAVAPEMRRVNVAAVISDLRDSVVGELDFGVEADRLDEFSSFLRENGLDRVATAPKPVRELCAPQVLTMSRLEGAPLVDAVSFQRPVFRFSLAFESG